MVEHQLWAIQGGDHDHRETHQDRIGLFRRQELRAVHDRHGQVEENHAGSGFGLKPINGLLAIGRFRRLVTTRFQDQTEGLSNVRIVVHDQDHGAEPPGQARVRGLAATPSTMWAYDRPTLFGSLSATVRNNLQAQLRSFPH